MKVGRMSRMKVRNWRKGAAVGCVVALTSLAGCAGTAEEAAKGPSVKVGVIVHEAGLLATPEVRKAVASTFYFIGPEGVEAAAALLDMMQHDEVEGVRWDAQIGLSKIGPVTLPYLVPLLCDQSPETRRRAIGAIGSMEPRQKWIIPTFMEMSKDEDPDVRNSALGYMRILDEDDPEVMLLE